MRTRIELVTLLDVPPEAAFDLARDIGVHERSLAHTGERAVAGRLSGLIGPGETVTFEARQLGIRWRLTSRVSPDDWEPPHRFVDEQVAGPFRRFRHEHRFEPTASGTRMTDRWEHELRWGPFGRMVDALVVRRLVRRLIEQRAAALADIARHGSDSHHGSEPVRSPRLLRAVGSAVLAILLVAPLAVALHRLTRGGGPSDGSQGWRNRTAGRSTHRRHAHRQPGRGEEQAGGDARA